MKALNTMKYMSNLIETLTEYKARIELAETYEAAKTTAYKMFGYIDCMTTFLNTMICKENNDFTAELDEVIDEWMVKVYQTMIDKANETEQSDDLVWKLCEARDQYQN